MNNFTYIRTSDADQAQQERVEVMSSAYLAGGTNILDLMKYNLTAPSRLIDIHQVTELKELTELENGLVRLGSGMTNAETAYHPVIEHRYPILSRAILAGASPQIRNMATNGGNLLQRTRCYYFYDSEMPCNKRQPGSGCPAIDGYNRNMAILGCSADCIAVYPSDMSVALAVLDAVINISGPGGQRQIAFADFHRLPGDTPHIDNNLLPGELITSIDLPSKGFADNYSYLKIRDRDSYAFALVSVASTLEISEGKIIEARIALGGVAHKPWRVPEAEQTLKGQSPVRENFQKAATIILNGAKGYQHNSFKIELARRAIIRNLEMALDPSSQRPGAKPSYE